MGFSAVNGKALEQQIQLALNNNRVDDAWKLTEELIKEGGVSGIVGYKYQGIIQELRGNSAAAEGLFKKYLDYFNDDGEAWYLKCQSSLTDAGGYEDCERAARLGYEPAKDLLPIEAYLSARERFSNATQDDVYENQISFEKMTESLDLIIKRAKEKRGHYPYYGSIPTIVRGLEQAADAGGLVEFQIKTVTVDGFGRKIKTETRSSSTPHMVSREGNMFEAYHNYQEGKRFAKESIKNIKGQIRKIAYSIPDRIRATGNISDAIMVEAGLDDHYNQKFSENEKICRYWKINYACALIKKELGQAGYQTWKNNYISWYDGYKQLFESAASYKAAVYEEELPEILSPIKEEIGALPDDFLQYIQLLPRDAVTESREKKRKVQEEREQAEAEKLEKKRNFPPRAAWYAILKGFPLKVLPPFLFGWLGFIMNAYVLTDASESILIAVVIVSFIMALVCAFILSGKEDLKMPARIIYCIIHAILYFINLGVFVFGLIALFILWRKSKKVVE